METYSRMHVKEGTVLKLVCPDDKCHGDVPPNLLKRFLGNANFQRWERLILQKILDSMADVAYCPRCETACLENEDNNAHRSKCFFSFYTCCRERRHIVESCVIMTPEEKLLSLQERQKVRQLSKGDIDRTIKLANEIFNLKEVLRVYIPCPYCGTAISRVSGCNQIVCSNCGKGFCYACGQALCHGCSMARNNDPRRQETTTISSAGHAKFTTAHCAGGGSEVHGALWMQAAHRRPLDPSNPDKEDDNFRSEVQSL